jgi:glucokinase
VIAAGTGLGEAFLFWDGERHHPVASEGGHVDFAPRDDREIALLRWLRRRLDGRVSYERVLTGAGLRNLYAFLRDAGEGPESPAVAERLAREDPAAVISAFGLSGKDALCAAALSLFCSLYGAEAGNLALKWLSTGGARGRGIAPESPAEGAFLRSAGEGVIGRSWRRWRSASAGAAHTSPARLTTRGG